jgi:hypothetical protein
MELGFLGASILSKCDTLLQAFLCIFSILNKGIAGGLMKIITAITLLLSSFSVFAATPCTGASTTLTSAQRKMYARSISSNLTKWQSPALIKIDETLTLHNWTAVWAAPKDMEQGVFIYSQEKSGLTFHDVWGGYAEPSDKPIIVRWVKKLAPSVPDDFAECVAETITAGH